MEDTLFIQATRNKVRFDTRQGSLSVEDLWDIPLTSKKANEANLDNIAIELDQTIKSSSVTSFVTNRTKGSKENELKFNLVLHIIAVRKAEQEKAETALANAEKKRQILTLINQKQNEALAGKTEEELIAMINDL